MSCVDVLRGCPCVDVLLRAHPFSLYGSRNGRKRMVAQIRAGRWLLRSGSPAAAKTEPAREASQRLSPTLGKAGEVTRLDLLRRDVVHAVAELLGQRRPSPRCRRHPPNLRARSLSGRCRADSCRAASAFRLERAAVGNLAFLSAHHCFHRRDPRTGSSRTAPESARREAPGRTGAPRSKK